MIAALALAADLRTLQLSDWSEVHLRGGTNQNVVMDLSTSPSGTLVLRGHKTHLTLTYQPFFSLADIGQPPLQPLVFQTATLDAGWQGRFTHVSLTENGTYGELPSQLVNTINNQQIVNGGNGAGGVSSSGTIHYAASITTLSAGWSPSRFWQIEARGSYLLNGGVTAEDRNVIALQYGPAAGLIVTYVASRRNSVYMRVDGTRTETTLGPCIDELGTPTVTPPPGTPLPTCQPDSYLGRVLAGGSRALSPVSSASLAAGVGVARARLHQEDDYTNTPYPLVIGTYEYHLKEEAHRVDLRFEADLSPFIDTRSGAVDDRVQVSGTGSWLSGHITVSGTLGGASTVVSSQILPTKIAFLTSRVDDRLNRNLLVTFGLSFFWQNQEDAEDIFSAIASVGIVAETLPLRF